MAGTHVCLRRVEAAAIYEAIAREGVTHLCGAPVVMNMLLNAGAGLKRSLDRRIEMMSAGAPPPAAVIEGMEALGFHITHVYGLTECYGPGVVCAWHRADRRTSLGRNRAARRSDRRTSLGRNRAARRADRRTSLGRNRAARRRQRRSSTYPQAFLVSPGSLIESSGHQVVVTTFSNHRSPLGRMMLSFGARAISLSSRTVRC